MDARHMHCSICKHPVGLRAEAGRRRAALIEDGLTLCDVCASAAERHTARGDRWQRVA